MVSVVVLFRIRMDLKKYIFFTSIQIKNREWKMHECWIALSEHLRYGNYLNWPLCLLLFTYFIFWLKSFYCDCRNNTLQCLPCFYPSTLKINNIFSSNPTLLKMATPVMRVKKILDHIAARTHISNIFIVFIRNK